MRSRRAFVENLWPCKGIIFMHQIKPTIFLEDRQVCSSTPSYFEAHAHTTVSLHPQESVSNKLSDWVIIDSNAYQKMINFGLTNIWYVSSLSCFEIIASPFLLLVIYLHLIRCNLITVCDGFFFPWIYTQHELTSVQVRTMHWFHLMYGARAPIVIWT